MFKEMPGPRPHFSAYHEDNSLLIQFMIVEFLKTHQLIFQINALILDSLNINKPTDTFFPLVVQIFEQLVGYHPHEERSTYSLWTKGSLTKLKEYCERYSRNITHQNQESANLHMATHDAWLAATHTLELLNALYVNPYTQNSKSLLLFIPIKRALSTMKSRFNQVIRLIPYVVNEYLNNENVILCFMRKRSLFCQIYGTRFLSKHFKWTIQTKALIPWLIQRYQERGFETFIPTIRQILESASEAEGKYHDAH